MTCLSTSCARLDVGRVSVLLDCMLVPWCHADISPSHNFDFQIAAPHATFTHVLASVAYLSCASTWFLDRDSSVDIIFHCILISATRVNKSSDLNIARLA
jgi:hypothetical protein